MDVETEVRAECAVCGKELVRLDHVVDGAVLGTRRRGRYRWRRKRGAVTVVCEGCFWKRTRWERLCEWMFVG